MELHKLQFENTLYLANKLKGKHIDFAKNKMNVRLAAQTLSSSVADAITYLRDEIKLPQFCGSEETCEFIKMFDKIFDLCNSSNCFAKGQKSALNRENFASKMQIVADACDYIMSLSDCSGIPLVRGKRKTGFLGFIASLHSITAVARKLLFRRNYSFFMTYRLSQDHLETFFSKIRRKGGCNNNPNALQFQWAVRALLQKKNGVTGSNRANCQELPEVCNTLFADSSAADASLLPSDESPTVKSSSDKETPETHLTKLLVKPGIYHEHVLHYIAGFICRTMLKKIRCADCSASLTGGSTTDVAAVFTQTKDRGGLLYASPDFLKIIKAADRSLRRLLVDAKDGPIASVTAVTTRLVSIEVLESLRSKVFTELNGHCMEHHAVTENDDHTSQIIKEAYHRFCHIVLAQHGRLYTERFVQKNQGSLRQKLTKTILFLHM